jgi:hypothetical protein
MNYTICKSVPLQKIILEVLVFCLSQCFQIEYKFNYHFNYVFEKELSLEYWPMNTSCFQSSHLKFLFWDWFHRLKFFLTFSVSGVECKESTLKTGPNH